MLSHYTKKDKLAQFDAVLAERDTLRLAVHDLACKSSKFKFGSTVTVDSGKEIDGDYTDKYRVSVSPRSMPLYMVETIGLNGSCGVVILTEAEIEAERNSQYIFWRSVRHAIWKIEQLRRQSA